MFQNPVFGTPSEEKVKERLYKAVSSLIVRLKRYIRTTSRISFKEYNFAELKTLFEEQAETYKAYDNIWRYSREF